MHKIPLTLIFLSKKNENFFLTHIFNFVFSKITFTCENKDLRTVCFYYPF